MNREGYVFHSYGDEKYVWHALTAIHTIRRYDVKRPVALIASESHLAEAAKHASELKITIMDRLADEHSSIVGFKHHIHQYLPFDRNLFLDSDMICCRNPDRLWKTLSGYEFTITGNLRADHFFGAAKDFGVLADIFLNRRRRTMGRFGIRYLPRIQSGMIYAASAEQTERVCREAQAMLARKHETHFQSRLYERGRALESCEWSFAIAMARLGIPLLPWMNGYESPQMDYIGSWVEHDADFQNVQCRYYTDPQVHRLCGVQNKSLQHLLLNLHTIWPGKSDVMSVCPYWLHFGWMHQKKPFYEFSEKLWHRKPS